jgi:hypothetical protein
MDQDQDFSKLRNLLALKKLDMPSDTQVDQFLIEFHRRQRAQLLVPASSLARAMDWIKERVAALELAPSLSYTAAFAALAITAIVGLSQQVTVTAAPGQPYQLSFQMPTRESAFAMIPTSFGGAISSQKTVENTSFTSNRSDSATTRFVLANNPRVAYDSTVAF